MELRGSVLGLWLLVASSLALASENGTTAPTIVSLELRTPVIKTIPSNTSVQLNLTSEVGAGDQFWIFELHTQQTQLMLELERPVPPSPPPKPNDTDTRTFYDSGSHLGLTVLRSDLPPPPENASETWHPNVTAWVTNPGPDAVSALLLVRAYATGSPVPAGCIKQNQTAVVKRPGIHLSWDRHLVRLNFSQAGVLGIPGFTCNATDPTVLDSLTYAVYHRFLDARNFDETYLLTEMAETMLLEDDIVSKGSLVNQGFVTVPDLEFAQFALFDSYVGVPSLFAVIVTRNGNQSTVYVTGASYGCNLDEDAPAACSVVTFPLTKLICAMLIFVGVFLAFAGHRFFHASQVLFSLMASYLIIYVIVLSSAEFSFGVAIVVTFLCGTIVALLWSAIWIVFGIPILSVLVPQLLSGFLVASSLFFLPFLQTPAFANNALYWPILFTVTLLLPLVFVSFSQVASILSCVIVGTFAFVLPVDFFSGGSLVYILINVVRRASIKEFNMAVVTPPFGANDGVLLVVFVGLALVALLFQSVRERGRPPFPPNPYPQWRWRREQQEESFRFEQQGERAPLLSSSSNTTSGVPGQVGGAVLDPHMAEQVVSSMRAATDAITTAADIMRNSGHGGFAPTAPPAFSSPAVVQPASSSSTGARSMVRRESEMQQAASRDPFKPTTPEGEAV